MNPFEVSLQEQRYAMDSRLKEDNAEELFIQLCMYRRDPALFSIHTVKWATAKLLDGVQSPSLLTLAGLETDDSFQVEKIFGKVVEELSLTEFSPNQALWRYVRLIAKRAIEQTLSAKVALNEISQLFVSSSYHERLSPFVYLSDDIERLSNCELPLFYTDLRKENVDQYIMEESRKLVVELDRLIADEK